MHSPVSHGQGWVDVRTRLLAVIVVDLLLLSSGTRFVQVPALLVLAVLLVLERAVRGAAWIVGAWAVVMALSRWVLPQVPGGVVIMTALLYTVPYVIAAGYGYYFVRSTTPSELTGGLNRMRVPRFVIIPLAVMLRFSATVREDAAAITDAMRLRGLVSPAAVIRHPLRTVEYLVVPLLAASVRSGEDLAASAMCRGLGAQVRPTTTARLGFGYGDALLGLVVLALASTAAI
ncbi:energy-coupling factor transporter transmembrane component T [Streptomyces natalensis]|uniref:Cobalt transporter n=1 Tax=Streptomyces natalensis ATCC 27448 TaxID=1240678 RepID=A0A0D7CJQ9_9ACTN|nr:energy-coupling factor transporter transmembrane component T [Streptomyces natalensis]KIZ16438.1 hypothetical protein SNA_20645 [Streptomyces natalensis ATCC 27448]